MEPEGGQMTISEAAKEVSKPKFVHCTDVNWECSQACGDVDYCVRMAKRFDATTADLRKQLTDAHKDISHAVNEAKKYQLEYPWQHNTASEAVFAVGSAYQGVSKACDDLHKQLADARAENGHLKREKDARVYYQDLVYHACNVLDAVFGGKTIAGTHETTDGANFKDRCNNIRARVAELEREREYNQGKVAAAQAEINLLSIETKKWRCTDCAEHTPCEISIVFSDAKLPSYLKGNNRFRNRFCPCGESSKPHWYELPDRRCIHRNVCPIDCAMTHTRETDCEDYKSEEQALGGKGVNEGIEDE
jgi:hypothetical protein